MATSHVRVIPEFYTDPMPIPVGASISRLTARGDDLIATVRRPGLATADEGGLSMRYRLMASFQGGSYQAGVGPSDEEVTLFAACPPPEELGFRSSSGHWCKRVSVEEIDALWESRPIGRYRGERCMVLDDLGDRVHIAYLGRDLYLARRLGFWEVDRGVFEVVVPRQEIQELREERGEYELAAPGRWQPARLLGRGPPRDLGVQSARIRRRAGHRPPRVPSGRRGNSWTPGRRGRPGRGAA